MSLLQRLFRIGVSNANAVVDKMEDQVKMADQIVRELSGLTVLENLLLAPVHQSGEAIADRIETGKLAEDQANELLAEAVKHRNAVGWATLQDKSVGFSVGVPTKLVKFATTRTKNGGTIYDFDGKIGYVGSSWTSPGVFCVRVFGAKGLMHYEIDFGTWDTPDQLHQTSTLYIQRGKDGYGKREELPVPESDMFRAELEMFADSCRSGKANELSARNGNVALAVVYAGLRSIERSASRLPEN